LAYMIGYKEFYGRNFFVNRNVLIPRPDTETVIDAILKKYKNNPNLNILELGVGSGCIIITLLLELGCKGLGIDISQDALDVAVHNAKLYNSLYNLIFLQSNWFQNISLKNKFDIIVSNPPYINQSEIGMMSEETLLYEPELALYTDSYKSYKEIALLAKNHLKKNGVVYIEIGFAQEQDIIDIFLENNYKKLDHFYDINNIVRVLSFTN
jgi:release factor glutamine methyltransferase